MNGQAGHQKAAIATALAGDFAWNWSSSGGPSVNCPPNGQLFNIITTHIIATLYTLPQLRGHFCLPAASSFCSISPFQDATDALSLAWSLD